MAGDGEATSEGVAVAAKVGALRVLVTSLTFLECKFAQTVVSALLASKGKNEGFFSESVVVTVLCGEEAGVIKASHRHDAFKRRLLGTSTPQDRLEFMIVPVAQRGATKHHFEEGAETYSSAIDTFCPDVVIGIGATCATNVGNAPFIYITDDPVPDSIHALRRAVCAIATSAKDVAALEAIASHEHEVCVEFRMLPHPVSPELIRAAGALIPRTPFISQGTRPEPFVSSIISFRRRGDEQPPRNGWGARRYVVGQGSTFVAAAAQLKDFFKAHSLIPCLIAEQTPRQLSELFANSLVHVQDCTKRSGVADAALFGVPSITQASVDYFPSPSLSITTSFSKPSYLAATLRSLLAPSKREALILVGNAARAVAERHFGKLAFAKALSGCIEWTLQHAYRASPLPTKRKMKRKSSSLHTNVVGTFMNGGDCGTWPWLDILAWASDDMDNGIVMQYDLASYRTYICRSLLQLAPYKLAARILDELDASVAVLVDGKDDATIRRIRKCYRGQSLDKMGVDWSWATHFLNMEPNPENVKAAKAVAAASAAMRTPGKKIKSKAKIMKKKASFDGVCGEVSKTRYALVPARTTEFGFWSLLFQLVKAETVRYLSNKNTKYM